VGVRKGLSLPLFSQRRRVSRETPRYLAAGPIESLLEGVLNVCICMQNDDMA
jgi:hypothetical protein